MSSKLRVGVAGPVGSGKTALLETLCLSLKNNYEIAVVTNDIYTKEDANFLINKKVLDEGRIVGVETGGCPHTAIRIIPIGSTKAQLIQRDLLAIISKVSKEIMDKEIDDIYFGNVGLAMAQQNHNDLYTKLFRN